MVSENQQDGEAIAQENSELRLEVESLKGDVCTLVERVDTYQQVRSELETVREKLRENMENRDALMKEVVHLSAKFKESVENSDRRVGEVEMLLLRRNNEGKVLMQRIQELTSRYQPVKNDVVDVTLARYIHGYRPAVPFVRLSAGSYIFGSRHVLAKVSNDKPVFRIGGGFVSFEKFLETYAAEELDRLLQYDETNWEGDKNAQLMIRMQQAYKNHQEVLARMGTRGTHRDSRLQAVGGDGPQGVPPDSAGCTSTMDS